MNTFRSDYIIAAGGNIPSDAGSPTRSVIKSIHQIKAKHVLIRSVSRFFLTKAYPAGSGPDYVNAAFVLSCDLSPDEVMRRLSEVEQDFGRQRSARWGQRTLDLDMIGCGTTVRPDHATQTRWRNLSVAQQQRETPADLILPHPRIQDRAFVLVPLCDICPDWQHPVLKKTVREMCQALPAEEIGAVRPI